jgi:hypothetical protein
MFSIEDWKLQLEFAIFVSFESKILIRDTGPDLLTGTDVPKTKISF